MTTPNSLLPCPFCAEPPFLTDGEYRIEHQDQCMFTRGHVLHPSEYKAWNTRSTTPSSQEVKEFSGYLQEDKSLKFDDDLTWQQRYSQAFHEMYQGILSEEQIKYSIEWNINFIEEHALKGQPQTQGKRELNEKELHDLWFESTSSCMDSWTAKFIKAIVKLYGGKENK